MLTDTFILIPYTTNCVGGAGEIQFNPITNRLYITDSGCNLIYEFDSLTDTLLKTYNDLGNYGIQGVYGIGIGYLKQYLV